jgi:hypothetical protein
LNLGENQPFGGEDQVIFGEDQLIAVEDQLFFVNIHLNIDENQLNFVRIWLKAGHLVSYCLNFYQGVGLFDLAPTPS